MNRRMKLSAVLSTALGGVALLAGLTMPLAAQAQAWPAKQPIKLVAVFPPGGSVDQVSRILQPVLQQALGQTVIVENKGGASGSIGAGQVAAAAPDGYTFAVVFDTHGVNPSLIPNLPYDARKDLTTVAMLGTSAMVVSTHADTPYKTFADVVAAAKAGKNLSYGTIGNGSLGHLAMTLLTRSAAVDITHVPYKGGGPLMQDALAGHVPLAIGSVFVSKPHIDSKRLRPLAVTTDKRSAQLPDVPTLAESGYAGFNAPAWWAVLAPAKTPAEIVARVNSEINKALQLPDVAAKLAAQGIVVNIGTPAAAQTFVENQMDTWAKVVKDNHIKAD
ncbi:tripartite tricarboxylate transporter substrate binding protein [Piscinibacter sakaiensis]|uniref:tripartite tricarboxylate transporter substrate binding protein n=1 Tax=Piscinibacter sakaiensis TaxID=1547922 RepID=UPI003AABA702